LLKIRLARVGKKKQPTYRVVIADARAPRDGAFVEIIGHYNPRTQPTTFEVDDGKVVDWIRKGAQPTERVEKLLAKRGITRESAKTGATTLAATAPAAASMATAPAVTETPA
jgi:small subunit ribosomal protein S16